MGCQTEERVELYAKVPSFAINDKVPEELEIWGVVTGMRNGRAPGAPGLRAEHLKQWLDDAQEEEKTEEVEIDLKAMANVLRN